ncbi:MAG TPA: hypothetical protein VNX68_08835 [Nitrosopumilaceae archaeon]|jgi:hypothetical protein|nr:hypothetical protein [Nitrosopumilaceae archaeon]
MFRIPIPKTGGEVLNEGIRNLMERLMREKQIENEAQYRNATLSLQQQELPSQIELRKAQANKLNQQSDLPFGGRMMPGAAGKALALFMVKRKYGENSPEYKEAKELYDLDKRRSEQTINYQESLMNSQGKRYATPLGKRAQEEQQIAEGVMPGTGNNGNPGLSLTPQQRDKLKGQYDLKDLKDTTDSGVRQRILYSKNMEKTLNNLNVDDLTSYSGIKGSAELLKDEAFSQTGNIPPRYLKYKQSLTAADTLAKQVRQFYGDSITPGVQEGLKQLTNPTTWREHPKVAKERFNAFKKILLTEAKTFTDAAHSANIYKEEPITNSIKEENNDPFGIRS